MADITLQALLDELSREGGDLAAVLQASEASTADSLTRLAELESEAVEAFENLYNAEDKGPDAVAALTALTDTIEAIRAEQGRLDGVAAAEAAELEALASRVRATADDTAADEAAEGDEPAADDAAEGEDGTPIEGLEVDTTTDTAVAEAVAETAETAAVVVPDDASTIVEAETVTAAGSALARRGPATATATPTRRRVNLSDIAKRTTRPAPPSKPESSLGSVMFAASDALDVPAGASFNTWTDVANAAIRRLKSMPQPRGMRKDRDAVQSQRGEVFALQKPMTYGLAHIQKPKVEGLTVEDHGSFQALVDYAADETRLSGPEGSGSLVAAAGWCGPSERWLDLCELRDSNDGIFEIPEVQVDAGVVEYWQGPTYCELWDQAQDGFFGPYTSADADAAVVKPCFEIPCPDDPQECELTAWGLCLTAGILTRSTSWGAAVIERFIQFALRAHRRRISAVDLAAVYAGSVDQGTINLGAGATADILNAIELQVEVQRYRERMARNATLELVAPYWVLPLIRADLANREGMDVFAVTDVQIRAWFAMRGVRVQWVYDWQPIAGCGQTPPNGIGGPTTPVTNYPTTVEFMLYPAGVWVAATNDVITLDTLYSPELLRTNRYQALFTEEARCIINRCPGSYRFTVPVCGNGAVGPRVDICATP